MENWLPILDYVRYKRISISTIRRYIKANRVKYKMESGRYYILVPNFQERPSTDSEGRGLLQLTLENEALRKEVQKYQEEISELRMLVSLYEKKDNSTLPQHSETLTQEELPRLPN